ncbi:MAG: response regulator [Deltaproteobacteria bacterium]|nr:response regulator [Deltaproteobacteria bacterium]
MTRRGVSKRRMAGERILVVDDSATIRRVVEMTLVRAGFAVECAVDGQDGIARAQESPPDLVLLDFVMPRMNGYQFCHALRGIANLRDTPVVLMSAKGDKIGGQFVEQTGAVDAITKPFSPDALLAVVEHVIAKWKGRSTPEATPEERTDENPPVAEDLNERAAQRLADAAQEIAVRVATRTVEAVIRQRPELAPLVRELESSVAAAFGRDALDRLGAELRALEAGERGLQALAGDLGMVPLGEILQLLQLQKQTGVLEIQGEPAEIAICFRDGVIDLAQSRGGPQDMLLGRYLIEEDLISKQDLDMLLKNRTGNRLLGDQLVKLGYILADDLHRALTRQTSELIYEVLRWRGGTFRFSKGARRPEADAARLDLPVASILLEGFRRVDEWRLIEQHIESFDLVLHRDDEAIDRMGSGRLTREEALVLDFVNGRNTVRDIAERSRMGSFEVSRVLYRLLQVGLIRKRSANAA